jgi:RecA-family ATPase
MSFSKFWELGYKNLVPIVPPAAKVSPNSSFAKRPGALGKAVGYRGTDGLWRGYDWLKANAPTEAQISEWQAMGAGVGIRTGNGLIAVDIDTLDPELAKVAAKDAIRILGDAPVRYGKKPKAILLYRAKGVIPYSRIEFQGANGKNERIEILSDDRQFVAEGIHPGTGKPYEWPIGIMPYKELAEVTAEQVEAFMQVLSTHLPAASKVELTAANDRSTIDQTKLSGDLEHIAKAIRATPNTTAQFPTYDDYIRMGAAIKGATQNNPDTGLQLFLEWADKWEGDNDLAVAEADYKRIKPPFELGASYLYEQAERYNPAGFTRADVWFDQIEDTPVSPFDVQRIESEIKKDIEELHVLRPMDWDGKTPATREWEVEGWIPRGEVTLLYGDGGVGKTLLMHQYATAAAAGYEWLGQATRKAKVMCFFCEDSEDELHRRQIDINGQLCLDLNDIDDNLRIIPRKFKDNAFAHWDRSTGAIKIQPIWHQLRQAALNFGAEVLIIDTIADVFAGSEIDRVQVNSFVKACLGRLAQEIKGTVIALGHPSMSGKSSGAGTSGSTAWSNAARSRIYMRYPKNKDTGNIREIEGMKLNYGPKGNILKIEWRKGAFSILAGSTASAESAKFIPTLADANQNAVLRALHVAEGQSMSMAKQAANFAPRVLKMAAPAELESIDTATIEETIRRLEMEGVIALVEVGRKENRHALYGYKIVQDKMSDKSPQNNSVFD